MLPLQDTCARTQCKAILRDGKPFYRIRNGSGDTNRDYCVKCGREILNWNNLEFEVINDPRPKNKTV